MCMIEHLFMAKYKILLYSFNNINNLLNMNKIFFMALVFLLSVGIAQAETFTTNLTIGNTGPQVIELQTWLENNGFLVMPTGVIKGYFGSITRSALVKYQLSQKINPAVGYFGPITRGRINVSKAVVSNECIVNQTAKFSAAKEYVKGNLLVNFKNDVSVDVAKNIINSLGYSYNDELLGSYSNIHTLSVIVPIGSEISASCSILKNINVADVGPNGIVRANI